MSIRDRDVPVIGDETVDHAADREAIEAIISTVETAYNTNDAELMVRDLAANAVVGNAVGVLQRGREAVLEASRAGLAGFLKDEYVRYEVTDIGFLRPDVAIAHKAARAVTAEGEPIDIDPAMIALYVLVKQDGRWWVAARQNTPVPQAA
ncbi:SgcJ/EcaC family oxidoreductase [Nocardia cyriacigeorgica]|uniref:SgcJ/EcaC family oxidoreductase n=1 Tax=Nocardia cyriacigeorgica TaxID=135487 RepID=A0A5R8NSY2_9NOCA|nr:SgcJ/EcaC family oxidoreductase [Nocardia cyriacigeorgica]TLF78711.1 SgcJ/EcaC family oxidoreductase [Nocardia cyriacigeorgica]